MELVGETDDEVVGLKRKLDQEAFAVYRNYYNFGWPIPPMERNLGVALSKQDNGSFEQERLTLGGFGSRSTLQH